MDLESQQLSPSPPSGTLAVESPPTKKTPLDILSSSEEHLGVAHAHLNALNVDLLLQASQFVLVVHEPELWHRSFPVQAYSHLLTSFQNVYRSGRAVNSGCRELSVIIVQMMERREDVSSHLGLLTYLSDHLFLVTTRANDALTMSHYALKRLLYFVFFSEFVQVLIL
jgi:hypothetical protein